MNEQPGEEQNAQDRLLAALAETKQRTPTPEPVCWRYLTPDQETTELDALADWITWFAGRYNIDPRTIPPCWNKHGALVEELSALRTLWEICYHPDAAPADPHTFHHALTHAMARLQEWTQRRGCTLNEHRPDLPRQ